MSMARCYGAKPDTFDYRDRKKKYYWYEVPNAILQPKVDLRKYVDHVYDQGNLGSCTANALCAAYGLDLTKQSLTISGYYYFDPSRLFLYYNTRESEGTTQKDSGASIRDTVKALNRQGVCKESLWPYVVKRFDREPLESCYTAAKENNLCKYERLDQDIDQFRACLSDNCPFVFGFNVYKSFGNACNANGGNMPVPTTEELLNQPDDTHAVMAVGYEDTKKCFIILNSWGKWWGDRGYFYMPYDFIKGSAVCFDFWKISFACERGKPQPANTSKHHISSDLEPLRG